MGQAQQALPLTLALNLGVSCKLKGTLPVLITLERRAETVVLGHPGGKLEVRPVVASGVLKSAEVHGTARMLMKGIVNGSYG